MSFPELNLQENGAKEPNFYRILGCDRTSSVDQITAEYRARVRSLHPDKVLGYSDANKEEYLLLQSAYTTLSNSDKRRCYDAWLDCFLPLSYEDFKRNQDAFKVSMHWTTLQKTPMVRTSEAEKEQKVIDRRNILSSWESDRYQSDFVRKFRNYEL